MEWRSIIFWAFAGAIGVAFELMRRRRLAPIFDRSCAGRHWHRAFPKAPKSDIREFLKLFMDAFALPRKHHLAVRPDDRILDLYHAVAPRWQSVDSLELETFSRLLEHRYGLRLNSIWRDDLTLGDVFGRTKS
jgi:propanediol dehydratase small subunit